ncbi:methylcytosine dioxygenase tet3-B-like isoform X2 [Argiope bruennichi]|uniref:methylcytosine dioxygenase tet3-B-like isoform X2 n=1 Tax=Argiope bruennichi TaxID=94029 RepID=UPI00249404FD|nr:methylcytosine dioxygenase tet3-B-like isoform X2 [Argiope bruennichi]
MSMNDKSRHVSVPQPLPANFGPPVPPVGPGPGQCVGQQPWMPNSVHPAPYHMPHQGYPSNYKSNTPIRAPEYPPMHPAGYVQRYSSYDAQCQSFPFGKIHEGPGRPPNPTAYPIVRHYNSQHVYNEVPKESPKNSLDMFPQSKSPGQAAVPKEKNNAQILEKNGRDDMSSPSDSKSDSEMNNTSTESCAEDTRSPTSCDKQENFFTEKSESSIKSISDSNSRSENEPLSKKCKVSNDASPERSSQTFSSISNSNNHAKKESSMHRPPYEMRIHNPSYQHADNMYGMYPEGERRMHNNNLQHNPNMGMNPHHMSDPMHYGYQGVSRGAVSDIDKLTDLDFSEKSNTSENVFQVPSISSTTPPKIFPPIPPSPISESWDDSKYYQQQEETDSEKVPRKKRKRCGECPGCLQKQNCGRCGPCRSVRSHQICKMRKCESLKTKKEKAAEESYKAGRKSKEIMNTANVESLRNSGNDIGGKMNGNPQSYLSHGDSQSPSNSSSMHLGSQSVRSHDQYQPQGNSFQQPAMINPYSSNSQYASYSPQVPPHNPHLQPMYDGRIAVSVDGAGDTDGSNSTHRMTNTRLKTLIHNRQNQREHGQLIPICNPVHDPSFASPVPLSPVNQQSYASPYLPPSNHQEVMHNSMPYSGPPETSSLMHLQQLSPNSITPPKSSVQNQWSDKTPPWTDGSSSSLSRKTPENSAPVLQKSPAKPSQNGHPELSQASEEPKIVNGGEKPENPSSNCALDTSSENVDLQNNPTKNLSESEKSEAKTVDQERKIPTPCDSSVNRANMPLHSSTGTPRYANPGFSSPPYAYRHPAPPQTLTPSAPSQQGCMPPPSSIPPMSGTTPHVSANGGHTHSGTSANPIPVPNEANCDESNQSPPFLLNTTTSMNTYINITNTYKSKLSFSNATCLPTFASTSVHNSTQAYVNSYSYNNQQMQLNFSENSPLLPKGGGNSKSYIDSGRIQDSFKRSDIPHNFGHQDLPLQPSAPNYLSHFPSNYANHTSNDFLDNNCSTPVGVGADKKDMDPLERIEKLRSNTKLEPPQCDCLKNKEVLPSEKLPYYTHLGSGASVSAIRELMECRSGEKGKAIRIEKLLYSGKEGKTSQGCPLAKWVIRRSGPEEKLLTVIRHRPGHTCPTAYIIIAMVAWEGVSEHVADMLYKTVVYKTVNFGIPTQRKCGTNEMRTCACQGLDPETCGASFSFGCSWSMYYNGCKFARSKNARKFKLTEKDEEKELEDKLQTLASDVALLYKRMAPESFYNQVVTLTKHKGWEKPEDEQLHVLPLYVIDSTDEYGSKEGQDKKIASGALEVLEKFPVDFKIRTTPLKPCKTRGRKPKDGFSPRKQALQTAFKQLIASGKLRRIEPPGVYQKCHLGSNRLVPLLSHNQTSGHLDNKEFMTMKYGSSNGFSNSVQASALIPSNAYKGEEAACKFYAGKHISHNSYLNNSCTSNQSWMPQSQHNFNCISSTENSQNPPINTFQGGCFHNANSSFSKYDSVPATRGSTSKGSSDIGTNSLQINHSFTNTCSKITSGTYVTSSCNVPCYNDRNNNYMSGVTYTTPPHFATSQSYQLSNTGSTNSAYSHYNSGMNSNVASPTYASQNHVSNSHNSYSYPSHQNIDNNYHFQNNSSFQNQCPYSAPNIPLKIPGNYSASNSIHPQHSSPGNYNYIPYSASQMTLNNNFCNYAAQKPCNVPENFAVPDHQNNYIDLNSEQQKMHSSSSNNFNKIPSSHYQNSTANQNNFVKSENVSQSSNVFPEKCANPQSEISDSVYALRDLDSKSVNCFSKANQQVTPECNSEKENMLCKTENTNFKYCENNNNIVSETYNIHAKNYNYHLQQSNQMLYYDNFSGICNYTNCVNSDNSAVMEFGNEAYKEGYEKDVKDGLPTNYDSRKAGSNMKDQEVSSNSNKLLESWECENKYSYPEPNHLGVLTSKYSNASVEDEEGYVDSTTIEGDEVYEGHSDNESSFKDVEVGGVAIALTHGSVLFECAKHELHSTTAVKNPNRRNPTRISLVFYQHKQLNFENHGESEWGQKMKEKRVGNLKNVDTQFDVSPNKKQCFQPEEEYPKSNMPMRMPCTTPTTNWMTVFPMPPLAVGAPFRT